MWCERELKPMALFLGVLLLGVAGSVLFAYIDYAK